MNRIACIAFFVFLFITHSLQAEPTVTMYTSGNGIQDMVFSNEFIFCATTGGVVKWDTRDMSYKKIYVGGRPPGKFHQHGRQ